MELIGICPGGELRDEVELTKERRHHLTGIVALAELIQLPHDVRQRILNLRDRDLGVVLPLALETRVMLEKLLAKEIRETLTGRVDEGVLEPQNIGRSQSTFRNHHRVGRFSV